MKLPSITTLAVTLGTVLVTALPSYPILDIHSLSPRQTPPPDLLTITALYYGETCTGPQSYWYISTRVDTWLSAFEKTDGCQPVNASWEIVSAKAAYLAEGCKLSFYTDKECKENSKTPPLDVCVVSDNKENWRSFAIRGCVATSSNGGEY